MMQMKGTLLLAQEQYKCKVGALASSSKTKQNTKQTFLQEVMLFSDQPVTLGHILTCKMG